MFWVRFSLYFVFMMLHASVAVADGCDDTAFLAGVVMNERQFNPENRAAAEEDFGRALGMAASSTEGQMLLQVFNQAWNSPRVPPNDRAQFIGDFAMIIRNQCYSEGWDQ